MTDVTIVCPTFARAGMVKSFGVFGDDLLLVVAARQLEEYRAAYPNAKFDPHPDELNGLSLVRKWMYEKYGDMFMVDDDVPCMWDYSKDRPEKVPPDTARAVVHRMADQAEQMGAYLYGCSEERNPLRYTPHSPFHLKGEIRMRCAGLRAGAKFFFPTDQNVDEETTLCALNAYFHRYCLIDNRYAMPGDQYSVGGLAARRNHATLLLWVQKLRVMFGDAVTSQAMGDAKLKVPW